MGGEGEAEGGEGGERKGGEREGGRVEEGRREGRKEGAFTGVSYVSGMLSILRDGTLKNQPN